MPIYMMKNQGVYVRYTPTNTTLLYLPLETTHTYTDQSLSHKTVTNTGVQFGTYSGVNCAYFNGSSYLTLPVMNSGTNFTYSFWCNYTKGASNTYGGYGPATNNGRAMWEVWIRSSPRIGVSYPIEGQSGSSTGVDSAIFTQGRNMFTFTKSSSGLGSVYINGSFSASTDRVEKNSQLNYGSYNVSMALGTNKYSSSGAVTYLGYFSEVIFDDKLWSASEISTQFNNMRGYFNV